MSSKKFGHTFNVLGMLAAETGLGEPVRACQHRCDGVAELGSESPHTVPVQAHLWPPL